VISEAPGVSNIDQLEVSRLKRKFAAESLEEFLVVPIAEFECTDAILVFGISDDIRKHCGPNSAEDTCIEADIWQDVPLYVGFHLWWCFEEIHRRTSKATHLTGMDVFNEHINVFLDFVKNEWQYRDIHLPRIEKRINEERKLVPSHLKGELIDRLQMKDSPLEVYCDELVAQQRKRRKTPSIPTMTSREPINLEAPRTQTKGKESEATYRSDRVLEIFASLLPDGVLAMKLAKVMSEHSKSGNDRMVEATELFPELYRRNSVEWAELLGVNSAAVRKTDFWKRIRRDAIAIAEAAERQRREAKKE